MQFGSPVLLIFLLLIPFVGWLLWQNLRWKNRAMQRFADARFQQEIFGKKRGIPKIIAAGLLLSLFFLILALVDFTKGQEKVASRQKVANVLFVLDVSNSMNAQDVEPRRLDLAKNILLNVLPQLGRDRVGLVVFAGEARSVMPLTTDYSSAENYISGLETSIVKVQGTDFLKAMQVAAQKFKSVEKGNRQVVFLSDGEDNENNLQPAIDLAKEEGIRVTTIGIGTEQGGPIPDYLMGQLMGYKADMSGETVISRRETAALKELASATGGIYIPGDSQPQAEAELLEDIQAVASRGSSVMVDSSQAEHYYQYPLAAFLGIFLLILSLNPKRDLNL